MNRVQYRVPRRACTPRRLYPRIAGNLDEDTRLQGSDGFYTATVSPAWEIWGPNGGYMATLALRAGGAEAHIKRPVSFYCQYLSS